ncbi:MAG TPA: tetratricopeptide repeat protein, partial [Spirillospora sp.]
LALAYCREQKAPADAIRLYETVWRTDRNYINAAFGLARVHLATGDRDAAIAVLDSVPKTSIRYVPAQVAAVATAVRGRSPAELDPDALVRASDRLAALDLDAERRDRLAAEILEAALGWLLHTSSALPAVRGARAGGSHTAAGGSLFGAPIAEVPLRRELEARYRELARRSRDRDECRRLVDAANAVRPRTLL